MNWTHPNVRKGLTGLLLVALTILLFPYLESVKLLTPRGGYDALQQSNLNDILGMYEFRDGWESSTKTEVDSDVYQLAQQYFSSRQKQALTQHFRVVTEVNGELSAPAGRRITVKLVRDLAGNVLGFEKPGAFGELTQPLDTDRATLLARAFLQSHGADSSTTELESSSTDRAGERSVSRTLIFSEASALCDSIIHEHHLVIADTSIISWQHKLVVADTFDAGKFPETADTIVKVLTVLIWIAAFILGVSVFFKRFRKDQIEFVQAYRLGVGLSIIFAAVAIYAQWGQWGSMLAVVLVGAPFFALFTTFCYAVAESYARDVWSAKFNLLDIVIGGNWRVRDLGRSILSSLLFGGAAAFAVTLIREISGWIPGMFIELEDMPLWVFSIGGSDSQFYELAWESIYVWIIIVVFGISVLKNRMASNKWLLIVSTLLLVFTIGLDMLGQPLFLSLLICLPLGYAGAVIVMKEDFLTSLLSLFVALLVLIISPVTLNPDGWLSADSLAIPTLLAAFFLLAVYLLGTAEEASDFAGYVPEYVRRVAERERIERELEIARRIQFQFLPQKMPEFRGLDIASICKPAMEVGGDYYDFIVNEEKRLSVVIGDVSGKGVSAAFYMTMTKGIIKTLSKWVKDPSKLLTELNEVFYQNAPRNVFISILFGIFDMNASTLTFSRAGHNPLLVRKKLQQHAELLNPEGLAIGMDDGAVFSKVIKEESVHIEPGDVFLFYTDGISEAMNQRNEEYGEERLAELLSRCADLDAAGILEKITSSVGQFAGDAPQHDDVTMVVVKVLP